ncbi:hypothetical protein DS742_25385 [Lacrimispora amygdalina]|uniref:Uncharacterized protein n=1 Tax=Lacrimispora amygdalina TaxID=253257 RepID=A0A3E2N551_9FIRM|nr:hypothetical protein [Clostridium indicum]RFZ76110.1 hypothetical protein DS742_25385 [Clostridium indicum]
MDTLAILEKFEEVEISNVSRISPEELAFCTTQQVLYRKVLGQHFYSFDVLQQLKDDCQEFMQSIDEDNAYDSHGSTYHHYSCSYVELQKEDFALQHIGSIHNRFISIILGYFKRKYNVSIDEPEYELLLGIKKPERPEHSFYGFRDLSDEYKEKLRLQSQAYEDAYNAYLDAVINAELDYNLLLDHIFLELNGSTFAERVEQEIKEASQKATCTYHKKVNYEIKNKKIAFDILYPRKDFRNSYEVELNGEGYLAILRALSYFNSDKCQNEIYSGWYRFTGYSKYESDGIFDSHEAGSSKVLGFKYYKNGKFEVTFDTHTTAREFALEFLYSEGVKSAD